MNAPHCSTAFAVRMLATLATAGLLVQCSMPPHEAWRSIQTQGLLPYLSSATRHQSPPFRTGGSYAQRYAAYPRRSHYGALGSSGFVPNSYFSTLSPAGVSSRYVPRTRLSRPSVERSPDVKIPVEEPRHAHAPNITPNPPPANETPKISADSEAATTDLPYGTAVPGRMNMVNSPFAGKTQLVDVSGMSAGQTVKCPYTGKLFKVPPTQQAANHVEPRLEPKLEAPKQGDLPQEGDKKP
ncbi:MAG: hypothetical protein J0L73_03685 [Verrucomicrobia bacterium]|nr:hypothetical protein [Verrucomicrobiota bacterium]